MKRGIVRRMLVIAFCVAAAAFETSIVGAQPVSDRILSSVEVSEEPGCAVVKVNLNFPARYISHFPAEIGDELRIKLQPIEISRDDRRGLLRRESLRAPDSELAAISEIVYEGGDLTGPTLTLFFRHPVAFKVGKGTDSRSLVIAISGTTPSDYCIPAYPRS